MKSEQFWQNFKLGQEQEIASNFIYDGLRNLHDMETLGYETEIFPVLYNLSIGLERLFKVAIILMEFDDHTDIKKFEKSFKIHDHLGLLKRVEKGNSLKLKQAHIELLKLLSVFYQEQRYNRLSFQFFTSFSKDKKSFLNFLHKYLGVKIEEESSLFYVENSLEIKDFVGRIVKDIVNELYIIIQEYAGRKNLYTYEISSSSSKAGKVLMGDSPITFENEDIAMIEVLIFLIKTKESTLVDFIKDIESLPLDPALSSEYLQALLHKRPKEMQGVIDEIEACYEEMDKLKDRLERIKAIRDPSIGISLCDLN
jgi:hypothetical protein